MENYNNFIELLRKFECKSISEFDDESDEIIGEKRLYNGFPCNEFEDIDDYERHLKKLFKAAFVDIKQAVDGLLLNSNSPSLLDVFFQSKIDDLTGIEKVIGERNEEVTRAKANFEHIWHQSKEEFDQEGGTDFDKRQIEFFGGWSRWKRCEELYYRDDIDTQRLAEEGLSIKDSAADICFAYVVMEKQQRDMIKSTKNRLNELYAIYCPNQDTEKESKQPQKTKVQVEKDFRFYLNHGNIDALVEKLHELLDGEKGKVVAVTIKALEKLKFIKVLKHRAALYKAMRNEFGDIGAFQGLHDFYNKLSDENPKMHANLKQDLQHQIEILSKIK